MLLLGALCFSSASFRGKAARLGVLHDGCLDHAPCTIQFKHIEYGPRKYPESYDGAGALDGATRSGRRREVPPAPRRWRRCFWTAEGQAAQVETQTAPAREHGRLSLGIDERTLRESRWSGGLRRGRAPAVRSAVDPADGNSSREGSVVIERLRCCTGVR
ncbi:hypothetical protein NDU88_007934 [Pleurodeles waltl]|uniref:Secreted protein n=1 Tax=Pleurodeles waltl TaxID=8319 RepID=A0AAV7PMQ2_PLEWA|nr:hypothetical protein NDU88_007934 [Pleurodeles waltl]